MTAPTPGPEHDGYETRFDAVEERQSEAAYAADYEAVAAGPPGEEVAARAALLPEERAVGSADPEAQAAAVLEDSLLRTEVPGAAPAMHLEHRSSQDTV